MERYRIQVAGHLDGRWSEWFAGLEVTNQPDGTTILQGPLVDQGALFGVLLRIRDLNVRLLSLQLATGDGRSVEHTGTTPPGESHSLVEKIYNLLRLPAQEGGIGTESVTI